MSAGHEQSINDIYIYSTFIHKSFYLVEIHHVGKCMHLAYKSFSHLASSKTLLYGWPFDSWNYGFKTKHSCSSCVGQTAWVPHTPTPRESQHGPTRAFYEPLDHCDGQDSASFSILSASTIIIITITMIYCGFCCHHYCARIIIIQYVWCVQYGYVCQQNTLTYYDILRNKKSCVRIIHHVLQFRSCNSIDIVPKAIQMMSDIIIKNTNNYVAIGRVWKISKILQEDPRRSSSPARPTSPVRPLSWTAAVWASVTVTRPSDGPFDIMLWPVFGR